MCRVMCRAAPRSALVLLFAMVMMTTIALADDVEDAVVEWTDADTFDPAECAAVSFHDTDTIPAHRWFTPDVPLSAAEQRRAASRHENTGGDRATNEVDGSQQRRLRKSRRRNRRGSGGGSSSPSSPVGTFNGIAISTMKCVGDHCDKERMPQDVHCGVVAPVPKSTGAVVTTDMLEWECHVVRPPHLAETVQFHSVAPECQSVIDGTPVRLPHPNALIAGHRRLLDNDVTLTAADVLRNASEDDGQGKGRAFTVVPNTFAVSRESAEWRDTAAAAKDETEECEFDLKLRRIRLSELLALRQVVDGVDAETAATHAFAQMQRGSGAVVATTSGNAPEQGATAGSDPLVFAEVCRVTFRVRLIYKPALIGGVLAILMTIVVFFVVLVVGTSNKKARDEVARARVVKSLDRAEMDAAARAGRPFEGSRAAAGSASSQRQAPSLQEALAQLRGSSQPSPLSGRPSGLSGQSADQAGVIQRGLEAGLSVDEILLREDILRRRDSAEVPRGMSASQFARERQATRLSGRAVAPLHAVVDGLPTMHAAGPTGKSSKTLSPAGKSYNAARNGGWGPNIDGAVD